MTFQEEWEILKKEYSKKTAVLIEKHKNDPPCLDGGAGEECDILWKSEFLPRLKELKIKYGM